MAEGWIKIHRKFTDWEWYDDINVKCLFLHCLIKSNHEFKTWRGINIKRGSFFTSLNHLSGELNLSVKQIRIALSKLERTGEIIQKGASKGTMITVCNYDSYQDIKKPKGKRGASEGQGKGKRGATTKNDKNEENEKISFTVFWDLYDKKRGDISKLTRKWDALSIIDQNKIIEYIPKYKTSQPEKQYRKDPSTFLNNSSWNDEIIKTGDVELVKQETFNIKNYER